MELKKAKSQQQKLQRINSILAAAEKLFIDKHYHLPTAIEIATEADVAKGTLYLYFKSKEHIYLALIENYQQRFIEAIELELNRYENVTWPELIEFMVEHWQNTPEFGQLYRLLDAQLLANMDVNVITQYNNRLSNELKRLAPNFKVLNPLLEAQEWLHLCQLSLDLLTLAWLKSFPIKAIETTQPNNFRAMAILLLANHWQQTVEKDQEEEKPKSFLKKLIGS